MGRVRNGMETDMSNVRYIKISPRGFSNETFIARGTAAEIAAVDDLYADDVSAWAAPVKASHPDVRKAIADERRYGFADGKLRRAADVLA